MKSLDTLMEATVLPVGSVSEIGEVCEVVLPSPNWPSAFSPQQAAEPLSNCAQNSFRPA